MGIRTVYRTHVWGNWNILSCNGKRNGFLEGRTSNWRTLSGGFGSEKKRSSAGVRESSRPRISEPFQTLFLSPQTLGATVPAVTTESDVEVCLFWPISLHSVDYREKLTCEETHWNLKGFYLAGNVGVIFKCGVWLNRSSQQPWMSSNGAQNI